MPPRDEGKGSWLADLFALPNWGLLSSYFNVGVALMLGATPISYYLVEKLDASAAVVNTYGALNYVQLLQKHLKIAVPGLEPHFLIDTARNGVALVGEDCDAACNARSAGFGRRPTAQTALPSIDAYYWLASPAVSDGCADCGARSEPACARGLHRR